MKLSLSDAPMGARTCLSVLFLGALVPGCYERTLAPATPCTRAEVDLRIEANPVDSVDLLLMVDNSNSMEGEQGLLAAELPRMIEILASGDTDEDGDADFPPLRSLHVGVVTSDLGAGPALPPGEVVPSCDPGLGDDGILRTVSNGGAGCAASYPPVFAFEGATGVAEDFAHDVACVAVIGTGGCGFEQQLEATLKAVSPALADPTMVPDSYVSPLFAGGGTGHAGDTNAGFLRRDSALALMLVTDEEDCSVPDYSLFYDGDPRFSGGLNLRCFSYSTQLYDVQRYVDGFLQLRDEPGLLVFAGIMGVPVGTGGSSVAEYDATLADPRMVETVNAAGNRLEPSCMTADGDEAFPPRRMLAVARGLAEAGAATTVQSICAGDFRPAIDRVINLLGDVLEGACLPRPLNTAADGTVACDVIELLAAPSSTPRTTHCSELGPFAELIGTEVVEGTDVERELCRIRQLTLAELATGGAAGWYYDESEPVRERCTAFPPGQRVSFAGHSPPRGAEVRLACSQSVLRGTTETGPILAELGTFCEPGPETPGVAGADNACPAALLPSGADLDGDGSPERLTCDVLARSCAVGCTTDADCVRAGLASSVCDTRTLDAVTEGAVPEGLDANARYSICVNPTCS